MTDTGPLHLQQSNGANDPDACGGIHIHPRALCESEHVGAGTRIWAFAHVLPGARIGSDCNLGDHTFVEGGAWLGDRVTLKNGVCVWDRVTLEDDVFVGPNAVFTNDLVPRAAPHKSSPEQWLPTLVRSGAAIGANATVVCGVIVGPHALVGAGTVVAHDVPAHAVVVGNPARHVGWLCSCGERLDESPTNRWVCRCGHTYRMGAYGLDDDSSRLLRVCSSEGAASADGDETAPAVPTADSRA